MDCLLLHCVVILWAVKSEAHFLPTAWNHINIPPCLLSKVYDRHIIQCDRCSDMHENPSFIESCYYCMCCSSYFYHYFLPPLAWSGQNVICQTSELHSIVVGSHWILEGVTVSTSYIGGSLDPGLYSMPQEITHCRMTANVCVQLCIGPILCPTTLSMGSHAWKLFAKYSMNELYCTWPYGKMRAALEAE